MRPTYNPEELYVIVESWYAMPDIYTSKEIAEKIAEDKLEAWIKAVKHFNPDYKDEEIGMMLKLNVTMNKFDVITLHKWICIHVREMDVNVFKNN